MKKKEFLFCFLKVRTINSKKTNKLMITKFLWIFFQMYFILLVDQ